MTTPVSQGGTALLPINLTAPAVLGLNTEAEGTLLTPEWATMLNNAVFDSAGRAAVRKGWDSITTSAVSGTIKRIFEYIQADDTIETIFSTDADIFSGTTSPSSVEGTLGISDGNIKFCNFNDKCIALGTGTSANPSVYTGTGNFTTVSVASGTAPTSGVGTSAYGRLWVVDQDGKTIRYSALLDETRWDAADGGGTIDMSRAWPAGQDVITAIEEFAGDLVIFGRNNIVMWSDNAKSTVGIDPTQMYISDTVPGIGCVSQFAITRAAGDLWFLSDSGVQTLRRALQDKTTPTNNVSKNVQSNVLGYLGQESTRDNITLEYSPYEDFVLCVFPQSNKVVCFDTRGMLQDSSYRVSEWSTDLQTCRYFTNDQEMYGALTGTAGEVMRHQGYNDGGTNYDFSYSSGWLDFGELNQNLKIVKRLTSFLWSGADTTVNFSLKYDFNTNPRNMPVSAQGVQGAEFNLSEFTGSDTSAAYIGYNDPNATNLVETEFGGGIALQVMRIPGKGYGQYVKVGCNLSTADASFALQQINLYAKIGRVA